MCGTRTHLSSARIDALIEERRLGGFVDLAGVELRVRGEVLAMLSCYLRPSLGVAGVNRTRLEALGGFLMALAGGWILDGDFNLTPAELEASGWVSVSVVSKS